MDDYFEGWIDDENIADKGMEQYHEDIKKAVKEKYGKNIKIELI
jgi:hypothetical protein